MASKGSRWDNEPEDPKEVALRKAEKEAKKKAKVDRERRLKEAEEARNLKQKQRDLEQQADSASAALAPQNNDVDEQQQPPTKRRRLSSDHDPGNIEPKKPAAPRLLRFPGPEIKPCRHVDEYEPLNHIEEGSYGIVSRAKDLTTGEIVALKKLKLEKERDGFPITSLREIHTLMAARHPNVVNLREVVMGDGLDQIYIVMDFIEHDLKTLLEDMPEPFLQSEIKTLMHQLISATALMHSHWIVHRDLKTSNLLMNNRGMIKVADFGLARYFGEPLLPMTQLVVTLWYRAPELLLGTREYDTAVDLWSIGCIFAELVTKEPLLQGKSEIDQLAKIFELLGVPTEENWPNFRRLPNAKSINFPRTKQTTGHLLRTKFPLLTNNAISLMSSLLTLNPADRISAKDALDHAYFKEEPRPKATEMFPTFPSKAGQEKRKRFNSPSAPMRGAVAPSIAGELGLQGRSGLFDVEDEEEKGAGFSLRVH